MYTLFVGLGNKISSQYEGTRHDVGADFLIAWSKKIQQKFSYNSKLKAYHLQYQNVHFVYFSSYMNTVGPLILRYMQYYKIPADNLCLTYDDMDLAFGKLRFKELGTSAGHNGVKSCIDALKTQTFGRLRIGVARSAVVPSARYVLQRFSSLEQKSLQALQVLFFEALQCLLDNKQENFSMTLEEVS